MTSVATPGRIVPADRLRGRLVMPADKSIAHRALIVNALSGGPATVEVRSPGQDVLSTVACLRALGVRIDEEHLGPVVRFRVSGTPVGNARLDCDNSGTTMRLLAGAVAGLPVRVTLDGDLSLRARPMERVATILRAAGADVTTTDGHAPIRVEGSSRLRAAEHRLPVASAQLLAAAALCGLSAEGETRITSPGPTRDHTERMLAAAGVPIRRDGAVTTIEGPAQPRALSMTVPGDLSSAAPWLVAAVTHPDADLTIADVGLNPTRTALVDLLARVGRSVRTDITGDSGVEPVGSVSVRSGVTTAPFTVAGHEAAALIDELPLIGILMATTGGEVRDASELRVKESDRIAAMVAGLRAIGASVEERPDGWRVTPGQPRDASIATHGDHRIAIAFTVAALTGVATGVELDDPACVAVSYPTFWDDVHAVTA